MGFDQEKPRSGEANTTRLAHAALPVLYVQIVPTKLFQSLHFVSLLLMVTMIFLAGATTAYSKGGGGHGGHSGGHTGGHAGSSPAHSAHHGEQSEHHEGHIGDHGHFRHFHDIHQIVQHRFGGRSYCLTDSFYYDETGVRHCCNTSGQPCFPLPASQKEITE